MLTRPKATGLSPARRRSGNPCSKSLQVTTPSSAMHRARHAQISRSWLAGTVDPAHTRNEAPARRARATWPAAAVPCRSTAAIRSSRSTTCSMTPCGCQQPASPATMHWCLAETAPTSQLRCHKLIRFPESLSQTAVIPTSVTTVPTSLSQVRSRRDRPTGSARCDTRCNTPSRPHSRPHNAWSDPHHGPVLHPGATPRCTPALHPHHQPPGRRAPPPGPDRREMLRIAQRPSPGMRHRTAKQRNGAGTPGKGPGFRRWSGLGGPSEMASS